MESRVAIVTPCYKERLSNYEEISLRQLNIVLLAYPKVFFMPEGSSFGYIPHEKVDTIHFKKEYFSDIHGYNRLLTSMEFYERFEEYEYILIAQPDTFVFSDQLVEWCQKKYDYVGAPWTFEVSDYSHTRDYLPLLHRYACLKKWRGLFGQDYLVGNGGFSLRRVETFIRILRDFPQKIKEFSEWSGALRRQGVSAAENEDNFWALFVPKFYKQFKIPKFKEALQFAFEVDPAYCYARNGQRLPFGCHDWAKHGLDFWKQFIQQSGFSV